jgi:hypothetical protein
MTNRELKEQAEVLCREINRALGWRASDPEHDSLKGYTGRIVLRERAVDEIVQRIERPGPSIWTPLVPGIAAAGLDVFLRLLDEVEGDEVESARLSAQDVPRAHQLPGLRERGHSGPPRRPRS